MRNKREYLLTKAYEQYLIHGYANVSVSVLQQELKIGRASLYYYFKDKDSLFAAIMDRFFLLPLETTLNTTSVQTLQQVIDNRSEGLEIIANNIKNLKNPQIHFSNIGALILSGYIHIPSFKERLTALGKKQLELWKNAIRRSIELGEIRKDCDIDLTAHLFNGIKSGYEDPNNKTTHVSSWYRKSCNYLFEMIKTKE